MSSAGNFGAQLNVIRRRMVPRFRLSVSRVVPRLSVHIASSFCALPLSPHFYPTVFFYRCDLQLFSFPLVVLVISLTVALTCSSGFSGPCRPFPSYSPHGPNPSIPHPRPTFTTRPQSTDPDLISHYLLPTSLLLHSIIYFILSFLFCCILTSKLKICFASCIAC